MRIWNVLSVENISKVNNLNGFPNVFKLGIFFEKILFVGSTWCLLVFFNVRNIFALVTWIENKQELQGISTIAT